MKVFEDFETDLLLKIYLERGLGKYKARYILYDKPRKDAQRSLTDNIRKSPKIDYNNVPEIPASDNIVIPAQVDEVINEQEQKQEPNYEVEELKLRIDTLQASLDQERADKKQLEEKYKQLEAKTRVSPSNQIPAVTRKYSKG